MPAPSLVVLTALKEELAAVEAAIPPADRERVKIIRAGIGWEAATRATQAALSNGAPRWICFSGFCGGLIDGMAVGDVVISNSFCAVEHTNISVAKELCEKISGALKSMGSKCHTGPIACARSAVTSVEQKRELARTSDAIAVDMESFAVAHSAAGACGVFALRAVSDAVTDALPPEIGGFLDANGDVRMTKVTRFMLGGPRNIKTLMDLKSRSEKAAASLTAAWKLAWPALMA